MKKNFTDLIETIATLRGPDGCPWDKKQTHESLIKCLQNESQELIDAINDVFRTHYEATMNTEIISPSIRQCERFVINELWHDVFKVLKQFEEV